MTTDQKLAIEAELGAGKVIWKRDHTIEARYGFFYRLGQSAEGKANKVQKLFPDAQIIEYEEIWKEWPKDSYFKVLFKLPCY
jgi:hypothetical protein